MEDEKDKPDEKPQEKPQERQTGPPPGMKRVRLVRSIVMNGEHAEAGELHDVSTALAHRLVGEGSAEHHLAPGEKANAGPTSVNRMESPINRDPVSRKIAPAPAKAKK